MHYYLYFQLKNNAVDIENDYDLVMMRFSNLKIIESLGPYSSFEELKIFSDMMMIDTLQIRITYIPSKSCRYRVEEAIRNGIINEDMVY